MGVFNVIGVKTYLTGFHYSIQIRGSTEKREDNVEAERRGKIMWTNFIH